MKEIFLNKMASSIGQFRVNLYKYIVTNHTYDRYYYCNESEPILFKMKLIYSSLDSNTTNNLEYLINEYNQSFNIGVKRPAKEAFKNIGIDIYNRPNYISHLYSMIKKKDYYKWLRKNKEEIPYYDSPLSHYLKTLNEIIAIPFLFLKQFSKEELKDFIVFKVNRLHDFNIENWNVESDNDDCFFKFSFITYTMKTDDDYTGYYNHVYYEFVDVDKIIQKPFSNLDNSNCNIIFSDNIKYLHNYSGFSLDKNPLNFFAFMSNDCRRKLFFSENRNHKNFYINEIFNNLINFRDDTYYSYYNKNTNYISNLFKNYLDNSTIQQLSYYNNLDSIFSTMLNIECFPESINNEKITSYHPYLYRIIFNKDDTSKLRELIKYKFDKDFKDFNNLNDRVNRLKEKLIKNGLNQEVIYLNKLLEKRSLT